jgi:hypothetical protein
MPVDPRLNSVHLEAPRREAFRQARDGLLNARGWQTVAAEKFEPLPDEEHPHTALMHAGQLPPPHVKFWLMDQEFVYPLKTGLNTIGRAPENDVVVPDAYVSRRHCAVLVHAGDGCELHDTASKNGTFLNGHKLANPTRLAPGDEIRMCDRQLVFMTQDADSAEPGSSHTQAD